MSDYSDVLYDPSIHTHSSCIQEVFNCDCVIVIIGSRFGGAVIPKALSLIDVESLKLKSKNVKFLEKSERISITQAEVLAAINEGIPVFTFIDAKVHSDHFLYEKNKGKEFSKNIEYPSIDKQDTAEYIFEFVNFMRHLTEGNAIEPFSRIEDIDSHLKKQWSMLLQRLLFQNRFKASEERKFDVLSKQIGDLQTAVLSSLPSNELKETAIGTIRFRWLVDFLLSLNDVEDGYLYSNIVWDNLMKLYDIVESQIITDPRKKFGTKARLALIKNDGTFYLSKLPHTSTEGLIKEWNEFRQLSQQRKEAIVTAIKSSASLFGQLEYIETPLDTFLKMNNGDDHSDRKSP